MPLCEPGEHRGKPCSHPFNTMTKIPPLPASLESLCQPAPAPVMISSALSLAILNSVAAEIAVLARDGMILAVNDAWRRFALENGLAPGQSATGTEVGANYLGVCQPVNATGSADVMNATEGIRAVLDGRLPGFQLEYPCHSPREQRWFSLSVTPLGEAAQGGVVVSHTNITQRIQAAHELSNVLAAVDQHAIVATTDVQGRITFVNDKLCEISGYSREELLGQNNRILNSGLHPKAFFQSLYQTIRAGHVWHGEVRNRAKDGHFYWVQTTITPFMGDDGLPVKYVVIRTDITRRKLAEVELQHHRDHLKELVRQKTADLRKNIEEKRRALAELKQQKFVLDEHASVTVTDLEGHITYANDKFSELSGYSHEEVMGQDHQLLNSGHHPRGFFKAMYKMIARGEVWHGEVCNRAKSGALYWVEMTVAAFMAEDGQPQAYIGVRTDITKRKRAEEAALAANQAKSEFLANMSHEIRTPMNGVIGMLDVLQQTQLDAPQHRMLTTIQSSSLALLAILNDILDLSKIEAGQLTLERLPTHLRALAEETAQLMATRASGFELSLSPELPQWIATDPTRLRQVLMNLLGNAFKFTPHTPERPAHIALHITPCTLAQGSPGLRLCVTDNGIGISPQAQAQLFQPFTQADTSTARKFGGTGLGLSISQRLVALMGGQIRVQSTLGKGTAFTVELPLQAANPGRDISPESGQPVERRRPPPRTPAPSIEEARATGRLVLLAEDNAINREVIEEQLRLLGYASETAEDGMAALALWRNGRFALLLTDCHMPHMDGFELTAAIRQAEPAGTRLPIVAITANARQGEAEHCRERGMDDYLAKPVRLKELGPMLAKWMPPELAVWDATTLPELVGDNPAMHQRLLDKFLIHAQAQVAAIGAATDTHELNTVEGVAHTLKSAARSAGALHLGELCQALETAGQAGEAASCRAVAVRLPQALADVHARISAHQASLARH